MDAAAREQARVAFTTAVAGKLAAEAKARLLAEELAVVRTALAAAEAVSAHMAPPPIDPKLMKNPALARRALATAERERVEAARAAARDRDASRVREDGLRAELAAAKRVAEELSKQVAAGATAAAAHDAAAEASARRAMVEKEVATATARLRRAHASEMAALKAEITPGKDVKALLAADAATIEQQERTIHALQVRVAALSASMRLASQHHADESGGKPQHNKSDVPPLDDDHNRTTPGGSASAAAELAAAAKREAALRKRLSEADTAAAASRKAHLTRVTQLEREVASLKQAAAVASLQHRSGPTDADWGNAPDSPTRALGPLTEQLGREVRERGSPPRPPPVARSDSTEVSGIQGVALWGVAVNEVSGVAPPPGDVTADTLASENAALRAKVQELQAAATHRTLLSRETEADLRRQVASLYAATRALEKSGEERGQLLQDAKAIADEARGKGMEAVRAEYAKSLALKDAALRACRAQIEGLIAEVAGGR